jgi:hypothetical protein
MQAGLVPRIPTGRPGIRMRSRVRARPGRALYRKYRFRGRRERQEAKTRPRGRRARQECRHACALQHARQAARGQPRTTTPHKPAGRPGWSGVGRVSPGNGEKGSA